MVIAVMFEASLVFHLRIAPYIRIAPPIRYLSGIGGLFLTKKIAGGGIF